MTSSERIGGALRAVHSEQFSQEIFSMTKKNGTKNGTVIVAPVERTSRGLANMLFDELDELRAGRSTPQQARAKANVVATMCALSRLEMDYARFVADTRGGASLKDVNAPKPVLMGG